MILYTTKVGPHIVAWSGTQADARLTTKAMKLIDNMFGWGLSPKCWLWGHLQLRRNNLVYDFELYFKRVRVTFTIWKKKTCLPNQISFEM